jgi:hypothetical protein
MRHFYIVLVLFMLFINLSGCGFDQPEDSCQSQINFEGIEAYFLEVDGVTYISESKDSLSFPYVLCQGSIAPTGIGFNGIFKIDGAITSDCEGTVCVEIQNTEDPFCVPTYQKTTDTISVNNKWYIAYFFEGQERYYPSCAYKDIFLEFNDSTQVGVAGLGVSGASFDMTTYADSSLIVANASLIESESSTGPYVGFVQNLIFNFIEVSDTLIYAITGNEMLLNTVDGDVGIMLYYD